MSDEGANSTPSPRRTCRPNVASSHLGEVKRVVRIQRRLQLGEAFTGISGGVDELEGLFDDTGLDSEVVECVDVERGQDLAMWAVSTTLENWSGAALEK